MKAMSISRFRADALTAINRVVCTKEGLIITKRGKPVVQIVPLQRPDSEGAPGSLAHTLVFEKDIVSPLGAKVWGTAQ